MLYILCNTMVL